MATQEQLNDLGLADSNTDKDDKPSLVLVVKNLAIEMDEWLSASKDPDWLKSEEVRKCVHAVLTCVKHAATSVQLNALLEQPPNENDTANLIKIHFFLDDCFELLKLLADFGRQGLFATRKFLTHIEESVLSLTESWSEFLHVLTDGKHRPRMNGLEQGQDNGQLVVVQHEAGEMNLTGFSKGLIPPTMITPPTEGPFANIPSYSVLIEMNNVSTEHWVFAELESMSEGTVDSERLLTFRLPISPSFNHQPSEAGGDFGSEGASDGEEDNDDDDRDSSSGVDGDVKFNFHKLMTPKQRRTIAVDRLSDRHKLRSPTQQSTVDQSNGEFQMPKAPRQETVSNHVTPAEGEGDSAATPSPGQQQNKPKRNQVAPKYRFLITIESFRGLPEECKSIELDFPGSTTPAILQVSEGVAKWNKNLVVDRQYFKWDEKPADAKFRVRWNGRKLAKLHLNLEQLRKDVDDVDGITAKSAHIGGAGGIFLTMDFSLDYAVIMDDKVYPRMSGSEAGPPKANTKALQSGESEFHVTLPPTGPLGASFSLEKVPPTIMRFVSLPDGSKGPLEDLVPPQSELVSFNGKDATSWTFHDFKRHMFLASAEKPVPRQLAFRLPSQKNDALNSHVSAAGLLSPKNLEEDFSDLMSQFSTNVDSEEGEVSEEDARVVAEFVSNPMARQFWVVNFGVRTSIQWRTFKESFEGEMACRCLPQEVFGGATADLLANHLDPWLRGSVHICSFNRLTQQHGLFGAISQVATTSATYLPGTREISPADGVSSIFDRTILLMGTDICSILSQRCEVPETYSRVNLWLEEFGELDRAVAAMEGVGVVVEFKEKIPLEPLRSHNRPGGSLNLVLKGRHHTDALFPAPYDINTVLYCQMSRQPARVKIDSARNALLEIAAVSEADAADELLFKAELSELQNWLGSSLTRDLDGSESFEAQAQEKSAIHLFKEHCMKTTQRFEKRQTARQDREAELISELEHLNRGENVNRIQQFFASLKNEEVKTINVSSETTKSWLQSLRGSAVQLFGDAAGKNDVLKLLMEKVHAGQRRTQLAALFKRLEKLKKESEKEDLIENELPGSYQMTCAEAERLVAQFHQTSQRAKSDALVAVYQCVLDKEKFNSLIERQIPGQLDRESITAVIKSLHSN